MCGIIGEWNDDYSYFVCDNLEHLKNRGPDGDGIFIMDDVTFGHTRLQIQGHCFQPFVYMDSMITYNGELWNTKEIRNKLNKKGIKQETTSDTELILQYYFHFCKNNESKLMKDLNGMFALAIYDSSLNNKIMMRDPIGEKPLYYSGDKFCSKGSVLSKDKKFNVNAFQELNAFGYPIESMYHHVNELQPGEIWKNYKIIKTQIEYEKSNYSKFKKSIIKSVQQKFVNSDREIVLCLSGGLDSSLILAIMRKEFPKSKINTITFSFDRKSEDYINANMIAKKYKTNHKNVIIKKDEFKSSISRLIEKIDYPFELGSVIITNLLCEHIKVKFPNCPVVILGDGADELFFGYDRHKEALEEIQNNNEYNYFERKIKNNCKVFFDKSDSMEDIRIIDFVELVQYHMKRIDQIFSEHGLEARCPFLHKDVVMSALHSNSKENIKFKGYHHNKWIQNKIWIRRLLESLDVPKVIYKQDKRALKAEKNMNKLRSEVINEWLLKSPILNSTNK